MLTDDAPKVYGLDEVEKTETVYITEGPFDSTFIRNSIALCGADGDVAKWGISNPVWIYDNEPRNPEIVRRISKTIDRGDKVVIWPPNIIKKDINELILDGITENEIMEIIKNNTYFGAIAKLKLNQWKRC